MATLESVFRKEFREVTAALRSVHSIYDLPNPLKGKLPIIKERVYRINGIEDPTFSFLNGKIVFGMAGIKPERRVIDPRNGKVKLNAAGEEIKETPVTPRSSIWIRSMEKVNIPRGKLGDGFNYADMWSNAPQNAKYIYAIPKANLYEMQMCALAASSRKLRAYHGFQFDTWTFGKLNVAVIPYNPTSTYQNTIILGVKPSVDFKAEMGAYVNGLIKEGVIPDIPYFGLESGQNLVETPIEAAYDEFEGESDLSLEERGALTYAQAEMRELGAEPVVEWEED